MSALTLKLRLQAAIIAGDLEKIKTYIIPDTMLQTVLDRKTFEVAFKHGNMEIIEYLFSYKKDILSDLIAFWPGLFYDQLEKASSFGNKTVFEYLYNLIQHSPQFAENQARSRVHIDRAFLLAAYNSRVEIVQFFLENMSSALTTPTIHITHCGNLQTFLLLHTSGRHFPDEEYQDLLYNAALRNDTELCFYLAENLHIRIGSRDAYTFLKDLLSQGNVQLLDYFRRIQNWDLHRFFDLSFALVNSNDVNVVRYLVEQAGYIAGKDDLQHALIRCKFEVFHYIFSVMPFEVAKTICLEYFQQIVLRARNETDGFRFFEMLMSIMDAQMYDELVPLIISIGSAEMLQFLHERKNIPITETMLTKVLQVMHYPTRHTLSIARYIITKLPDAVIEHPYLLLGKIVHFDDVSFLQFIMETKPGLFYNQVNIQRDFFDAAIKSPNVFRFLFFKSEMFGFEITAEMKTKALIISLQAGCWQVTEFLLRQNVPFEESLYSLLNQLFIFIRNENFDMLITLMRYAKEQVLQSMVHVLDHLRRNDLESEWTEQKTEKIMQTLFFFDKMWMKHRTKVQIKIWRNVLPRIYRNEHFAKKMAALACERFAQETGYQFEAAAQDTEEKPMD